MSADYTEKNRAPQGKLTELAVLLKRVVEAVQPDLRRSYRVVRKARVEVTYASDGRYWADVQPLRNDESVDEKEPIIPHVEIPVIWGGKPGRGVVCPPLVGAYCDLEYFDGDPNFPRISNFRWYNNPAPVALIDEYVTQYAEGVFYKFDPFGEWWAVVPKFHAIADALIELASGGDITATAVGDALMAAANVTVAAEGTALTEAEFATIRALSISLQGAATAYATLSVMGLFTAYGMATVWGELNVNGNFNVTGDIKTAALNSLNNAMETINSRLSGLEDAVRMLGGAV